MTGAAMTGAAMHVLTSVAELRVQLLTWKRAGQSIGFVPTMGNLHAGHHALIDLARQQAYRVVASVLPGQIDQRVVSGMQVDRSGQATCRSRRRQRVRQS